MRGGSHNNKRKSRKSKKSRKSRKSLTNAVPSTTDQQIHLIQGLLETRRREIKEHNRVIQDLRRETEEHYRKAFAGLQRVLNMQAAERAVPAMNMSSLLEGLAVIEKEIKEEEDPMMIALEKQLKGFGVK
jgi:wobble nucleotide-excising tRNase